MIIGTGFMDKYVTSIYPTERRFKPLISRSIAIFATGLSENLAIAAVSSQREKNILTVIKSVELK